MTRKEQKSAEANAARNARHRSKLIAAESRKQAAIEARETFQGFRIADLRVTFDSLTHPENWKKKLYGIVALPDLEKARAAAEFFAGSPLTVEYTEPEHFGPDRKAFVTGPGYYACIGA